MLQITSSFDQLSKMNLKQLRISFQTLKNSPVILGGNKENDCHYYKYFLINILNKEFVNFQLDNYF